MTRLILVIGVAAALAWVAARLWPAVRAEPSTWLGDNWRERIRHGGVGTRR